jgi:hypothetical protein
MFRLLLIVKVLGCYAGTLLGGVRQLLSSPPLPGYIPYSGSISEGDPALSPGTDAVQEDRYCPFCQRMMDTVVFDSAYLFTGYLSPSR